MILSCLSIEINEKNHSFIPAFLSESVFQNYQQKPIPLCDCKGVLLVCRVCNWVVYSSL